MSPMQPSNQTIQQYSDRAEEFTATYESLTFEQVHQQVLDLIPNKGSAVLDVGAGSGRDAAWFAQRPAPAGNTHLAPPSQE